MENTLQISNLSLQYRLRDDKTIDAVSDVSFDLQAGEILGIAGESGCGKTTLVSGCMGLILPPLTITEGSVVLSGKNIHSLSPNELRETILGREISIIPQGAFGSLCPTQKIGQLASHVLSAHPSFTTSDQVTYISKHFHDLGIADQQVLDAYPGQLTAGMRQRVVIALSTLLHPKVVIADEPTSALDVSTQKSVLGLIKKLIKENVISSMIMITHELPLLRHMANRIAVMYAGEFVEVGSTEQIIFDPVHPYTKALMDSMLRTDLYYTGTPSTLIQGAPPKLDKQIVGCRFAPRCSQAAPQCHTSSPKIRSILDRQVRCDKL